MNDEQAEINKAIAAAALDEIEHYQAQLNRGDRFIAGLPTGTVLEHRTVEPRKPGPGTACYVAFTVRRKPLDPR
jgi:hypothetical protein